MALYYVAFLYSFSYLCGTSAITSEPGCICSKFSYEESLLEKMIRGEIKFENLQQSVEKDITEMKAHLDDMKRENDERMQTIQSQQETMAVSTSTALGKVEKALNGLADIKVSLAIPTVLFSSKKASDTTLDDEQIIVFTEEVYDHGNGYDNTTGVFTAPVGGVYMFTVHLCGVKLKSIFYSIVVDGSEVTNGRHSDNDGWVCTSATAITPLQSNQKVWVKCKHNGDQLYQDIYRFNMFSGVLLHQ